MKLSKFAEALMAASLAIMVLLVFINVVLRYGFNDGIPESEDIARFLFIWLVFIGVIVAIKERGHLCMDAVVKMLPRKGKIGFLIVGHLIMLLALGLLLNGSWQQMILNNDNMAMGSIAYPLSWNYAAGVFSSVICMCIVGYRFLRIVAGRVREDDFVLTHETEVHIE